MTHMKLINVVVTTVCALFIGIALLFMFWFYYPYKVIELKNPDGTLFDPQKNLVHVLKTKVIAGETLPIQYTSCRYVDKVIEVNGQLINGTIHTFTPIHSNLPKGCRSATSTTWVIPLDTPSGKYHFVWTFSYPINPVRMFQLVIKSEEFQVENPVLDKLKEETLNGS